MSYTILNQLNFSSKNNLPMIYQAENTECGLCCLLMIAHYYGYKSSLTTERHKLNLSKEGISLLVISQLSEKMKLTSRGVRVNAERINLIKTPCILHWENKHFVVLKEVKNGTCFIHDPAIGCRELSHEDFAKNFSGIAMEFIPANDFKKVNNEIHLKFNQLWTNIVGLKRNLFFIILLSFFIQILSVIFPFYLQEVIDRVIVNHNYSLLTILAICFTLLLSVKIATEYTQSVLLLHLRTKLNLQLAVNAFRHLLRLPLNFFMNRHIGDLISKFRAIDEIRKAISVSVMNVIIESVMSLITLVMMVIYSTKLTFIVISIITLYLLLRYSSYSKLASLTQKSIINHASESSHLMETLRSIQSIKIHNKQSVRELQWINKYISAMNIDIQLDKWRINFNIFNQLIFNLGDIFIIYIAANLILSDTLSIGMLYAFISYKQHFFSKMGSLIDHVVDFKMVRIYMDRLGDIILSEKERENINNLGIKFSFEEKIEVKNISFRHSEYTDYVFQDINLTIYAGESVAITGPSGCGKTTLIKCLMRLLAPEKGEIRIDGIKMEDIDDLHTNISAVMQDDTLLSGSIIENITFFDDDYNIERVTECAKIACIYDDIMSLPMNFYTLVGDMGSSFSGGQKQRIILARALYMQPKILFLDEATSSLDKEIESTINENIKKLNITRIIVAHRAGTIQSAERIIDMKHLSNKNVLPHLN